MINEKLIKSSGLSDPEFTGVTTNLIIHLDAGHSSSYGGSGSTWSDLTANNNDFTLANYSGGSLPSHQASSGSNPYKIFRFSESNLNYAYRTTDIANLDNYTIETWVYDYSNDNNYSYYWSNDVQPFGSPYYYQLLRSAEDYGAKMHFYATYDGANYLGGASPGANVAVSYGDWTHWMLIKNGADVHVVKNGLIAQTLTAGERDSANLFYANTQGNPQYTSGRRVYIGTADHTNGSTNYYSNIEVSEVRFYSRALTEKEIRENYNATCSRYGNSAVTALSEDVHFAILGGGGGGGQGHASGGSGGGFRTSYTANTDLAKSGGNNPAEAKYSLKSGVTYTITVGGGGSGATSTGASGGFGGSSSIAASGQKTLYGSGGAAGSGGVSSSTAGQRGGAGSGGGGFIANRNGYKGTTGQGYGGGKNTAANYDYAGSGGSGGAGGAGGDVTSNPDHGGTGGRGIGFIMPQGGFNYFAGGGGGGSSNSSQSSGGGGGYFNSGGAGASNMTNATNGVYNFPSNSAASAGGGGGGGAGQSGIGFSNGGNGAAGMVYLRVPTATYTGTTTGSPRVWTSGSDKILLFTGSGSYTH